MGVSLNLAPAIREYHKLTVSFKRILNKTLKKKLYLYNANLYGWDEEFKIWLRDWKKINDLDALMQHTEKNYNPKSLYLKRSTGRQTIVNR